MGTRWREFLFVGFCVAACAVIAFVCLPPMIRDLIAEIRKVFL
jgi:hypothetical protein